MSLIVQELKELREDDPEKYQRFKGVAQNTTETSFELEILEWFGDDVLESYDEEYNGDHVQLFKDVETL